MPLPPLLLARLKRRGIIKEENAEEVIAENYDDDDEDDHDVDNDDERVSGDGPKRAFGASAPGCPNKWNPFHLCSEYCFDHWGDGIEEHRVDPVYNRRRLRMLRKYPLPESWTEVYDSGTGRYYYWNTNAAEVSWLAPTHPRAVITTPAVVLAKRFFEKLLKDHGSARPVKNRRRQNSDAESKTSSEESEDERRRVRRREGVENGLPVWTFEAKLKQELTRRSAARFSSKGRTPHLEQFFAKMLRHMKKENDRSIF